MSIETNLTSQSAQSTADSAQTLRAYAELIKLRISTMVLFTFCVTGVLSAGLNVDLLTLFYATVGMLLIASSGNAMNMYLERYTDFLMPRTSGRPLPAQKLSSTEVVSFASICFGASVAILGFLVNWPTAICGIATWILYVWVYTPLKTITPLNTEVGAIPGAMPILMGSLATTGGITEISFYFFLVLLIWQFPHFMSIAWMYRNQYEHGGLKMITVTDPTGKSAGLKAVATCILMIAVSLLPALLFEQRIVAVVFVLLALVFGWFYLKASWRFAINRNDQTARKLLKSSVLYLPMYMLIMVVGSFIG
ncbi:MAG: heme o synthase [Planctomycetota bacterium]